VSNPPSDIPSGIPSDTPSDQPSGRSGAAGRGPGLDPVAELAQVRSHLQQALAATDRLAARLGVDPDQTGQGGPAGTQNRGEGR